MSTPILEFFDVNFVYHTISSETLSLKQISFKLNKGEFISFVGPSGCGKTTLLNMVAGLIEPTYGSILINGKPANIRDTNIGYMLQKDHLLEWRNIYKNLTIGLEIQKKLTPENLKTIDDLLKAYGLWDFRNAYPRHLSGGMRQRVALIRTLALSPEILLLDEPFSALDYQTRLNVTTDIGSIIKSKGISTLLVTHDLGEAISMSDRVIVLTKRPGTIKQNITLNFTSNALTPKERRNTLDFNRYYNEIWEAVHDENEDFDA